MNDSSCNYEYVMLPCLHQDSVKPVKRSILTVIEVLPGMNLTRIPDWWLEHQDGIVSQEVADDESSIHIDWFVSLHLGQEPQHITLQSTSTEHQQICHK